MKETGRDGDLHHVDEAKVSNSFIKNEGYKKGLTNNVSRTLRI